VGDAEDARQLVERRRLRVEAEQVVRALGLVVDLVRQPAPSPHVVPDPAAAALLDELTGARDDLVVPPFGQLGIEDEQNFVCNNHFPRPPFLWTESASTAGTVREHAAR